MRTPANYPVFIAFVAALLFFLGTSNASGLFGRQQTADSAARQITNSALLAEQNTGTQSEEAKVFVQSMGDQVIDYIIDSSLTEASRKQKLEGILKKNFDTYTISRFALGPYWRSLTTSEQDEYQELFADVIVAIYSRNFSNYDGQQFVVTSVRAAPKNDYIVQSMILQRKAKDIPVGWHLRLKNGQFQIVDVTVENVSMIVTQKSEFSSIIQRRGGNPSVIIDHLRTKLGEAT